MIQVKVLTFLISLGLCTLSTFCIADNTRGFYAGAGLAAVNTDEHSSFGSRDLWAAEIIGGYKYNSFLGLELRYGVGVSAQSESIITTINNEDVIAEYDVLKVGGVSTLYYRLESINETGRFYGLLGYSNLDLELAGVNHSKSDLSWGVGLGFFMTPKWNLNFEYRHIADIQKNKITAITASIDYRF